MPPDGHFPIRVGSLASSVLERSRNTEIVESPGFTASRKRSPTSCTEPRLVSALSLPDLPVDSVDSSSFPSAKRE
jgi:hypothetical protein